MIKYVEGDATQPFGSGTKIIMHCCNDLGKWGKGFVVPLGKRFPGARELYLKPPQQEGGSVSFYVHDQDVELVVANIVGQRSVYPRGGVPPVRYEWLRAGFEKVRDFLQNVGGTVHCPRIGCGLAGGEWAKVEALLNEVLGDYDVYVYDLPGQPYVGR